jgi:NAD+ diphosphatase
MKIAFEKHNSENLEHPCPAHWFLFSGSRLFVILNKGSVDLPFLSRPDEMGVLVEEGLFLGLLSDNPCYAAVLPEDSIVPMGGEVRELRNLYGVLEGELFEMALRAFHFVQWNKTYRFCAACKGELQSEQSIRAKRCTQCGRFEFPRLSPAIIVLVERDGKALLGRSPRFAGEFYSVLAGFVEPGESLEDAVHREIMEEVGIEVKNIIYFGSQPWPFPDSLMIGFLAEYDSGEIKVDGEEIMDADWYGPQNLPTIPGKVSIARQLIDWFIEKHPITTSA